MKQARTIIGVFGVLLSGALHAEIYELPPDGYDVVGAVATVTARQEDTLIDIARRHGLGYHDIVRANPDVARSGLDTEALDALDRDFRAYIADLVRATRRTPSRPR